MTPERVHQLEAVERPVGGDEPPELGEHALGGDVARVPARCREPPRAVCASTSKSSSQASRASRSARSGSSANASRRHHPQPAVPRGRRARRAGRRARRRRSGCGDRVDREVALARGRASIVAPRSGSRSTCQRVVVARPPATRRTPPRARTGGRAPRAAERARQRAGVAVDDDVEVGRRRGRAARRGPRRRRATRARRRPRERVPAGRSCDRLPVAVVRARHARGDPAHDLVVDRVEPPWPAPRRSGARRRRARSASPASPTVHRRLGTEVDRDVVHADGADERVAPAADQHVAVVGQRRAGRRRRSRSAASRSRVRARR